MSSESGFQLSRRRSLATMAGAVAALALPRVNFAQVVAPAAAKSSYPAKVIDLLERSLVIDMLGPLKLDFTPQAYSTPLSDADAAMFRSSGITAFHNSVGVGGAAAYDDALQFIAAWSGFVGRNTEVFSLVGRAQDIDHAKAKQKIAVIMGLQNADEFRDVKDVKAFYELGLRCAQLTYNSQNLIGSGSTDRAASATTASRSSRR